MTADLVSRLLSAIQEREDHNQGVMRALEVIVGADGSVGSAGYIRAATAERLRLCQAHRKIIDRHSSQHVHVLAFDGGHFCVDCGTDASECTRRGVMVCQTCGMEPCGTLQALAEGYGIEAES